MIEKLYNPNNKELLNIKHRLSITSKLHDLGIDLNKNDTDALIVIIKNLCDILTQEKIGYTQDILDNLMKNNV